MREDTERERDGYCFWMAFWIGCLPTQVLYSLSNQRGVEEYKERWNLVFCLWLPYVQSSSASKYLAIYTPRVGTAYKEQESCITTTVLFGGVAAVTSFSPSCPSIFHLVWFVIIFIVLCNLLRLFNPPNTTLIGPF